MNNPVLFVHVTWSIYQSESILKFYAYVYECVTALDSLISLLKIIADTKIWN